MESLNYTNFSEQVHKEAALRRIPVNGIFETTYRCNLNCIHCYCNLSAETREKELSYNQICKIIDQIVQEGCLWLLITGGEPLIRDDFLSIYTYAKKKGLMIILFTNGTLLNKEIVKYLKDYPPFLVEITLYSMQPQTHEAVTRIPGSLEKTLNGIELLLKYGIRLNLKSTITKLNKTEIEEMKKYVKSLGLYFRFDPLLNPRYDGSQTPCSWRLSPQEVIGLDLSDEERIRDWREFCKKYLPSSLKDSLYTCGAGISSFCLNPYGNLQICQMVVHRGYNTNSFSFREIWYEFFPQILSRKSSLTYKCRTCNIEPLCSSCSGWAQIEEGNEENPPGYLCEIAQLRKEYFSQGGE